LPVFSATHVQAQENWGLCGVPSFEFLTPELAQDGDTKVEAQTITSDKDEQVLLQGDVTLLRAQQRIRADKVIVNKIDLTLSASGNVEFESPEYRVLSSSIEVDDKNSRSKFTKPEFEMPQRHARGSADQIEQLSSTKSRFSNLLYTACDPDDRVWHLRASEMEVDYESGRGSASHTTLYFKDVPIFYFPYFQFPVDDRRLSGILTPRFGYSEAQGSNIEIPVYWNIASNYDATITPSWYSERGAQLNTEGRYLLNNNRGQIDLSYLDDEEEDDSRWFQRWQHATDFRHDIKADLLITEASDAEFFDDFTNVAPEYNDLNHLDRHFRLSRQGEVWHSEVFWQQYQTLDRTSSVTSRPYNRLPQLALSGELEPLIDNSTTRIDAEWVSFDRDDSVTGERSHLVSALAWESTESWYFFKPELQFSFTDYQLDDNSDNMINRALPTLGVDTGLIFERLIGEQNQWLQTLEPRLYFLSTPFEDQDEIPDFDTALLPDTYTNMFKNNRFSGADRIGDANQVTFGLASRAFDNDSGNELMNLRTGRIFYFDDRRVSLDGTRDESTRSDVITELDLWPNARTRIGSRVVYDHENSDLNERDLTINYSDDGFAANLGYYFTEDELEQGLISLAYPINERWTLVAKHHQSLLFDKPVENLIGLNYESCCWGLKMLAGQSGDDTEDFEETDNSIYFEITFKGLSQAGDDIDRQLADAIPGYKSGF
jgi:LPS-assembly protein